MHNPSHRPNCHFCGVPLPDSPPSVLCEGYGFCSERCFRMWQQTGDHMGDSKQRKRLEEIVGPEKVREMEEQDE